MKDLQMIHLQEQHIKRLQTKLKELKRNFIDSLISCQDWETFLLRYTKTYYRPKGGAEKLRSAINGGNFCIEFPEDDSYTGTNPEDYVQIAIGYSRRGTNFRTGRIPMSEIEAFIEANKKPTPPDMPEYRRYTYWSTESYTVN